MGWDYAPLHAPCNKDKKHGQTDGNNGHIWHARCARQLALMQNNLTNIICTKN